MLNSSYFWLTFTDLYSWPNLFTKYKYICIYIYIDILFKLPYFYYFLDNIYIHVVLNKNKFYSYYKLI